MILSRSILESGLSNSFHFLTELLCEELTLLTCFLEIGFANCWSLEIAEKVSINARVVKIKDLVQNHQLQYSTQDVLQRQLNVGINCISQYYIGLSLDRVLALMACLCRCAVEHYTNKQMLTQLWKFALTFAFGLPNANPCETNWVAIASLRLEYLGYDWVKTQLWSKIKWLSYRVLKSQGYDECDRSDTICAIISNDTNNERSWAWLQVSSPISLSCDAY